MDRGREWIVDAWGCDPGALADAARLRAICDGVVGDVGLRVVGEPSWHVFPGPGGVTGLYLLAESHLACHTYPESGWASFNLYCCRPAPRWPWEDRLARELGASRVAVREVERG